LEGAGQGGVGAFCRCVKGFGRWRPVLAGFRKSTWPLRRWAQGPWGGNRVWEGGDRKVPGWGRAEGPWGKVKGEVDRREGRGYPKCACCGAWCPFMCVSGAR
jgi:hypothetical protein